MMTLAFDKIYKSYGKTKNIRKIWVQSTHMCTFVPSFFACFFYIVILTVKFLKWRELWEQQFN